MQRRAKELASKYQIPAVYGGRVFTKIGGMISYGDKRPESFRQIGVYTGPILNGENIADLPVMQPAKFELVINLVTAKARGIEVRPTLLAQFDDVIE